MEKPDRFYSFCANEVKTLTSSGFELGVLGAVIRRQAPTAPRLVFFTPRFSKENRPPEGGGRLPYWLAKSFDFP